MWTWPTKRGEERIPPAAPPRFPQLIIFANVWNWHTASISMSNPIFRCPCYLALEHAPRIGRSPLAECAQKLLDSGCEYVLVTGTHDSTPEVVNTLYHRGGVLRSDSWQRLPPGRYARQGIARRLRFREGRARA